MELKARTRTELGRKTNALRRAGFLPAVLYGERVPATPLKVSFKEFEKVLREAGESTLVTLDVEGNSHNVLIHDVTHDPIKGTPVHADFYAVRMDKKIQTKVPVHFMGESPAVKNEGGILVKVAQELEVEALPKDLPHWLEADLSSLGAFDSRILAKDIPLPAGVKFVVDFDEIIALVERPRSDQELESLKEAATLEVKEVLTEQEMKRAAGDEKEKEKEEVEKHP